MKRWLVGLLVSGLCGVCEAGDYGGGLVIDRIWSADDATYFGFGDTPADCEGGAYFGTHARLAANTPNYRAKLSILLAARVAGKRVDIWYVDRGACDAPSTLLDVTAVGVSAGQP